MPSPQQELRSSPCTIKFAPGDIVVHAKSGRRGVVIEVDRAFNGPDDRYRDMTHERGPKRKPWYYVLIENNPEAIYIAECHLRSDSSGQPINHPMITSVFTDFANGRYIRLNH